MLPKCSQVGHLGSQVGQLRSILAATWRPCPAPPLRGKAVREPRAKFPKIQPKIPECSSSRFQFSPTGVPTCMEVDAAVTVATSLRYLKVEVLHERSSLFRGQTLKNLRFFKVFVSSGSLDAIFVDFFFSCSSWRS